jgi:hypothetical protein
MLAACVRGPLAPPVTASAEMLPAGTMAIRPLPRPAALPTAAAAVPTGGAQTAAALDSTTAAEKAAATAAPAATGARALGRVSVALGSPVEQGFWLRAALVKAPGKGRVELASGATVAVDLIPGEGAAQLSLAAFRALGLALTDLPEVTVYAE